MKEAKIEIKGVGDGGRGIERERDEKLERD